MVLCEEIVTLSATIEEVIPALELQDRIELFPVLPAVGHPDTFESCVVF